MFVVCRQRWYDNFAATPAGTTPNTTSHARIVPMAEQSVWRASGQLLRNYARGVLRNVPANALSITVYELAKMTLE